MARITVEDCIDKFPSRFELVLVASQRARKLHSGETPTVEKNNDKNTVIALREIAEETITIEQMKENLIQDYQIVTISDEEDENLEVENINKEQIINEEELIDNKELKDNKELIDNIEESGLQIEEEINDLITKEDSELEKHYEISDNLHSSEENSSSEKDEKESLI